MKQSSKIRYPCCSACQRLCTLPIYAAFDAFYAFRSGVIEDFQTVFRDFSFWLCLLPWMLWAGSIYAGENGDTIVLTAQEIQDMQALKIADVLNHVPGVKAGSSSVEIHGSYKVKVFVDGRPINDPTSSYGAVNWDMVSPDDVKRIEILRGEGGLTYGQDASGGVVLITTKNHRRLSGHVKSYFGNFDTADAKAGVSATKGRLTGGLTGGYGRTGGYARNNDRERYQAGLKVDYASDSDNRFGFSADYLEDERGLAGYPEYPTPFSRKKSRNLSLALRSDVSGVKSQTSYNEGTNHNTDTSIGLDKTLTVSKLGQDLTTAFATTDRGKLNCGVTFSWDRANGTSFDDQQEYAGSVFAVQSLTLSDKATTLTVGLRASAFSAFDESLNPEVKAVYKKPSWQLTAAYSRTENIPSFYQRYNETSSMRPNPDLGVEKADNFSLSCFASPYEKFSFSLSGFYNLLGDRITHVTGDDGIGQYQNFGKVLYAGGDMALNWQLTDTVTTKASYTYLVAKDRETDLWIPSKARHNAHLDMYWKPCRALSVVAITTCTSKAYRNKSNTKTIPGYVIADLRAEYAFSPFQSVHRSRKCFRYDLLLRRRFAGAPAHLGNRRQLENLK